MSGHTAHLAARPAAQPVAEADPTSPETPIAKAHTADAYTCRLHPFVALVRPGFCRECGAALEPSHDEHAD